MDRVDPLSFTAGVLYSTTNKKIPKRSNFKSTPKKISLENPSLYPIPYIPGKVIGSGTYGTVRLCNDFNGKLYAIKETVPNFTEIDISMKCDHPNVIKTYGCVITDSHDHEERNISTYLIMEKGDHDLNNYVCSDPLLLVPDMVSGLHYLHTNKISHCDVKLSNFVKFGDTVKIVDFSLSSYSDRPIHTCHSLIYTAPEIWNKYFGASFKTGKFENLYSTDIWALGVCILSLFGLMVKNDFVFNIYEYLAHPRHYMRELSIPKRAKKMIFGLLDPNPKKRIENFSNLAHFLKIKNIETGYPIPNIVIDDNVDVPSFVLSIVDEVSALNFDVDVLFLAVDLFYRVHNKFHPSLMSKVAKGCVSLALDVIATCDYDISSYKQHITKVFSTREIITIAYNIFEELDGHIYIPNLSNGVRDIEKLTYRIKILHHPDIYMKMRRKCSPYFEKGYRIPFSLI